MGPIGNERVTLAATRIDNIAVAAFAAGAIHAAILVPAGTPLPWQRPVSVGVCTTVSGALHYLASRIPGSLEEPA